MAVRLAKTASEKIVQTLPTLKVGGLAVSIGTTLAVEYIEIYNDLKAFGLDAKFARMEELRKGLLVLTASMDAEKPAIFATDAGDVEFSKVPESRVVIDPLAVIHKIEENFSKEAAQSIAKVTIGDLEKILGENEIAPLVSMKSGTRRLVEVRPVGAGVEAAS